MDPHLNLFYSYNADNQLIENNLTRAWVVVLRLLTPESRDILLSRLIHPALEYQGSPKRFSFRDAQFALQGHIDPGFAHNCKHRYILTIASEDWKLVGEAPIIDASSGGSIPDAWIFDQEGDYCFLIEVKSGYYSLDAGQLYAHAINWLNIPAHQVEDHLLSFTWFDAASLIFELLQDISSLNLQERLILNDLSAYLGFFDYLPLKGISFMGLGAPPDLCLGSVFDLEMLPATPGFHLQSLSSINK